MTNAMDYYSRLHIHKYWERYVLPYGSKAWVIQNMTRD